MAEPENQAEREAYYAKIDKTDLSPLWTTTLVPARPKDFVRAVPIPGTSITHRARL